MVTASRGAGVDGRRVDGRHKPNTGHTLTQLYGFPRPSRGAGARCGARSPQRGSAAAGRMAVFCTALSWSHRPGVVSLPASTPFHDFLVAMTVTELRRLYAYSRWATTRLLHAAAALDPAALDRPLGTSFGTLRETVAHLYGVERLWLDRWLGGTIGAPSSPTELESIDAVERRWAAVWKGQDDFLRARTDAQLRDVFSYRNQSGLPASVGLADMLLHVANHATYHRGQIAAAIRQLGGTPAPTDFLLFARETPA